MSLSHLYTVTITFLIFMTIFYPIIAKDSKNFVQIKTAEDLIAHPKAFIKSIDKYIVHKMDILNQIVR